MESRNRGAGLRIHRGYCFIDYQSHEQAENCIKYMNGGQLDSNELEVCFSKDNRSAMIKQQREDYLKKKGVPVKKIDEFFAENLKRSGMDRLRGRMRGFSRSPDRFRRRSPLRSGRGRDRSPFDVRHRLSRRSPSDKTIEKFIT